MRKLDTGWRELESPDLDDWRLQLVSQGTLPTAVPIADPTLFRALVRDRGMKAAVESGVALRFPEAPIELRCPGYQHAVDHAWRQLGMPEEYATQYFRAPLKVAGNDSPRTVLLELSQPDSHWLLSGKSSIDCFLRGLKSKKTLENHHGGRYAVVASGAIQFISEEIDESALASVLGGEPDVVVAETR